MRKLRVPGKGRGRSGGYRVVTYFAGERAPAFMVAVLAKGSRANFSDAEINAFRRLSAVLVESLGPRAIG